MTRFFVLLLFLLLGIGVFAATKEKNAGKPEEPLPSPPEDPAPSPLDSVGLSFAPEIALQGVPVLVTVDGDINSAALSSLTFGDTELDMFYHNGRWEALIGINLHHPPGPVPLILTLADGRTIEKTLVVQERVMPQAEFSIPDSFGGNTPQGEETLETNWQADTVVLNDVTSRVTPEKLWDGPFRYPRDEPIVVTDTYGYSRQTGAVNFSHNGTDFRAAVGTPVYAMNSGRIAFAGTFRNYGHTVIIDHGMGLMTMYMHLSELLVEENQTVKKGVLIARSGNSGYSLAPHLHLSVRINGSSIDPEKFLELLGAS